MELFVGKPLLGPDGNEIDAEEALEGKEYLTEHCGGWLAIPFGDERIQEYLAKYEVPTIPALKVLNTDGSILIADARNQVQVSGRM
ncbi:hypothetical protein COOONC_11346 [Cooperia oncophora]